MIRTFTPDDLIRYFYGETTKEDTRHIAHALTQDEHLRQQYAELVDMGAVLDKAQMSPSRACEERILSYAKAQNAVSHFDRVTP